MIWHNNIVFHKNVIIRCFYAVNIFICNLAYGRQLHLRRDVVIPPYIDIAEQRLFILNANRYKVATVLAVIVFLKPRMFSYRQIHINTR